MRWRSLRSPCLVWPSAQALTLLLHLLNDPHNYTLPCRHQRGRAVERSARAQIAQAQNLVLCLLLAETHRGNRRGRMAELRSNAPVPRNARTAQTLRRRSREPVVVLCRVFSEWTNHSPHSCCVASTQGEPYWEEQVRPLWRTQGGSGKDGTRSVNPLRVAPTWDRNRPPACPL